MLTAILCINLNAILHQNLCFIRTTIEIPRELIEKAMKLSNAKTKRQLIKEALEDKINTIKRKRLLTYKGEIDLKMDLDILRDRK